MSLETGTVIADFDNKNPTKLDPKHQGDDHLRLIKSILQSQFPDGQGGNGFTAPILSTSKELNWSQGLTDNIQVQLDAIDDAGSLLAGQVNINTGDISTNKSNIASNDTDISNMNAIIIQLNTALNELTGRVNTLELRIPVAVTGTIRGADGALTSFARDPIGPTVTTSKLATGRYQVSMSFGLGTPYRVLASSNGSTAVYRQSATTFVVETYISGGVLYNADEISFMVM